MSWQEPDRPQTGILRGLLQPAAAVYGLGSYLRLKAYAGKLLKQANLSVPVISIGNITCGGTGKTPLTIEVACQLVKSGYKPAVLSRGYKRKSRAPWVVVSDGISCLTSCEDAGDEPFLMAMEMPGHCCDCRCSTESHVPHRR